MNIKQLIKTKTFWSGLFSAVTAILPSLGVPVPPGVPEAFLGLMGIFLRDAMIKK